MLAAHRNHFKKYLGPPSLLIGLAADADISQDGEPLAWVLYFLIRALLDAGTETL